MDRISNLPEVLTEKILMCLPLGDAVKTSVLSKQWRYKWTTIPSLIFDYSFLFGILEKQNKSMKSAYSYMRIVNSLLLQHTGPLEEFNLFTLDFRSERDIYYQCLCNAFLRGVKKLVIMDLHSWPSFCPPAPSLTYLEINCLTFGKRFSLRGFPNLNSLVFDPVTCDLDTLNSVISECPNLRRIKLANILHEGELNICAPKLEYLFVEGMFLSICLQGAQNIREMELRQNITEMELSLINVYDYSAWSMGNLVSFFSCLKKLESLTLGGAIHKVMAQVGLLTKLPRILDGLRFLKLDFVGSSDLEMLHFILGFIHSSPNLCRLEIRAYIPRRWVIEDGLDLPVERNELYNFPHLENVYIGPIIGTKIELELIEFLLFCTPSLKLMSIWDARQKKGMARTKVSKVLAQCHHASPTAKILISAKWTHNHLGW